MVLPSEASPAQRSRAGSSCDVGRPSGAERARLRRRRQMQCFRAARSSNFERLGGAERARAAILSAPVEPSGLERPFRAPQRSRAGSSGHFERPSGAERARCRKRRQVRCFRARPSRVRPEKPPKSEATNANLNIDMSDVRDVCINQPPGAACLPLLACATACLPLLAYRPW